MLTIFLFNKVNKMINIIEAINIIVSTKFIVASTVIQELLLLLFIAYEYTLKFSSIEMFIASSLVKSTSFTFIVSGFSCKYSLYSSIDDW